MIQIGVTGHRFLTELLKLQAGVDQALARIAQAYPGEGWTIVSSLAEGADRLVVQRARLIRPETRLVVPLPLAAADYLQDFPSEESRAEFTRLLGEAAEILGPPEASERSQGYALAGQMMLARSHVLVALWDGQPARGRGGTAEVVQWARQRGLPLAWVHCANRLPGEPEPVEPGRVTFEGF